jgi:hypothetical protein
MARPRAFGAPARRCIRRPQGFPRSSPALVTRTRNVAARPRAAPATKNGWPSYEGPGAGPKYAVFRVYLRWPDQRVSDKTVTRSRYLAWFEYRALCAREDLIGRPVAAAITANGKQLAYHGFDDPNPDDPWRRAR